MLLQKMVSVHYLNKFISQFKKFLVVLFVAHHVIRFFAQSGPRKFGQVDKR